MANGKALVGSVVFPRSKSIWSAILLWVPVLVWMGVIFWFSSQSSLPSLQEPFFEVLFKKSAHAGVFAVLAMLWWRAFMASGVCKDGKKAAALAVALCIAYALSDEFHQSFTPHRTPALTDVLIDTGGACVGAIVVSLWARKYGDIAK